MKATSRSSIDSGSLDMFRKRPALLIIPILLIVIISAAYLTIAFGPMPMQGAYMEPTIQPGDQIQIQYSYYSANPLSRGDIVAIKFKTVDVPTISRIISIPGDTVEFESGILLLNDKPLIEDYLQAPYQFTDNDIRLIIPPIERYGFVPEDKILVLNDNRETGLDSRTFGLVPKGYVLGKISIPNTE